MPPGVRLQVFGQATADLIEQQSHQRLGAVDVGGRHDEVKRDRLIASHNIADAPVGAACDFGHDRIAIQAEKRHRRRQHAAALVLGLVAQLARGAGNDRVRPRFAQMRGLHHGAQRGIHRALRIGQEFGHTCQGLVGFGVKHMQDGAHQQRMAGLFPMVALVETAFRIDEDVGDVLDVAHLPLAAAHFQQRIVGRGFRVGRVEEQHAAVLRAEAGGELPVLTLDVVDDGRPRPGQQRRDDEADAFARTCRGKAQDMLRPVMA